MLLHWGAHCLCELGRSWRPGQALLHQLRQLLGALKAVEAENASMASLSRGVPSRRRGIKSELLQGEGMWT